MSICLAVLFLPTIWIVDANSGPGTNFTDLPAAVAAAANGDTLIVRSGTYRPFQVSGKALMIRGADPTITFVQHDSVLAQTLIAAVPAGSIFAVSGISFLPATQVNVPVLRITGVSSVVALSHIVANGSNGGPSSFAAGALRIEGASVYVRASTFRGGSQFVFNPGSGGFGVRVEGGTLVAVDCSITGGSLQASDVFLTGGGTAVDVDSGRASLSGCSLTAGNATGTTTWGSPGLAVGFGGTASARVAGTVSSVVSAGTGSLG